MITKTKLMLGIPAAAFIVVACANYFMLTGPLQDAIKRDERNTGISIVAHYRYFVNPSEIVLDLRNVQSDKAPVDVTRVLFQFAESQQMRRYDRVVLAFRGKDKFQMEGEYFNKLGVEFETQNPVYTIRTLPQNLYTMGGEQAFGTWTGGILGVLGKQMEDFAEFHRKWYVDDMVEASNRK